MPFTNRTFFVCAFLLLVIELVLFLLCGIGAKREIIQLGERHFLTTASTLEIAVFLLPTLMACSVALGALGAVQNRIALPELLKRASCYVFVSGLLLSAAASYPHTIDWSERDYFTEKRWMHFGALILIMLPILMQLTGFVRYVRRSGGKEMRVARWYVGFGLFLMLWTLFRGFYSGRPPWREEYVFGASHIMSSLMVWPMGIVLGACALFLAALQRSIVFREGVKLIAAVAYFSGAIAFLFSMHRHLLQERAWETPIGWPIVAGLVLLIFALLVNFFGILRSQPADVSIASKDTA